MWVLQCLAVCAVCALCAHSYSLSRNNNRHTLLTRGSKPASKLNYYRRNTYFMMDSTQKNSNIDIISDKINNKTNSIATIPNDRKGPLNTMKKMLLMYILTVQLKSKLLYLKLATFINKLILKITGRSLASNNLVTSSNSNSKTSTFISNITRIILSPQFMLRFSIIALVGIIFNRYLYVTKGSIVEISYANFLKLIADAPDRVKALRVTASSMVFLLDGKQKVMAKIVNIHPTVIDKLVSANIDFAAASTPTNILGILWTCAYGYFLWSITTRMMQGPQDDGAGKRKDGKVLNKLGRLSFEDVAGQEKAKQEVKEICEMLKNPTKFTSIGARLPSGILLCGPPGTGKTLLARVAAAEAGVPFYACSASDFVEIFVGRGPARVRKLFKQAAENAPSIVFIDELDSIGRSRRMGSMNTEQENTLNQLLTSMDGLDTSNNGVIVMAATNRYELLDPALLRAGRFDRIVQCPLPDRNARYAILQVHTKKFKLAPNVDLEKIAKFIPGTCGADIAAIANEAAIRTARRGGTEVNADDFEDSMKSFYSGRGVPLSSLAEMTGLTLPNWLKPYFNNDKSPEAAAAS